MEIKAGRIRSENKLYKAIPGGVQLRGSMEGFQVFKHDWWSMLGDEDEEAKDMTSCGCEEDKDTSYTNNRKASGARRKLRFVLS